MKNDIVIIGSGNVATHLAQALYEKGENIVQVYSRQLANAELLAKRVGAEATDCLADIVADADIYIISVKDDAIQSVAGALSHVDRDSIVLHTAGSVPLTVLSSKFVNAAILYPMQTFSKTCGLDFSSVPCFVEASNQHTLQDVMQLARSVSTRVVEADSERRKYLHLAAVFACNMANHCYHLAECVMKEAGLDFSLLNPLIAETARKVQNMSPYDAQTGPMVRNDLSVMQAQLSMLKDDDMRALYELMAKSIRCRHPE